MTNFLTFFWISILGIFVQSWASAQDGCEFMENPAIAGDFCNTALPICGAQLNCFEGSLENKNDGIGQPSPLCQGDGTAENMQWFEVVATGTHITIVITPENCENIDYPESLGIQTGLYENCSFPWALSCDSDFTENAVVIDADVTPGETYYFYVDGYSASVCDYTIEVQQGISTEPIEINSTSGGGNNEKQVAGNNDLCTDGFAEFTYSIEGKCDVSTDDPLVSDQLLEDILAEWTCYEWSISPAIGWSISGDETGESIDVIWELPGNYTISVTTILPSTLYGQGCDCIEGDPCEILSLEVAVSEPEQVNLPDVFLCEGDSIEFCGKMYYGPDVVICDYPQECKYEVLNIFFKEDSTQNLGTILLCEGECYELEGVSFCDPGQYDYESTGSCNVTYSFEIQAVDFEVNLIGMENLTCITDTIFISADLLTDYNGQLTFEWFEGNTLLGIGTDIQFLQAGDYFLKISSDDYQNCYKEIPFTIELDKSAPVVTTDSGILDCETDEVQIQTSSNDDIDTYEWTGKNFQSFDQNPIVQDSGTYVLVVTGDNGCTAQYSHFVDAFYPPAQIDVDFTNLSCDIPTTILSFQADFDIDTWVWTGPEAKKYFEEQPEISEPGKYTLDLISTEGCDYSKLFTILGDFEEPEFEIDDSDEWSCHTTEMPITLTIGNTNDYTSEWSTSNGEIVSEFGQSDIIVGTPGMYYITMINESNGCYVIDSIEVITDGNIPEEIIYEKQDLICYGEPNGAIIVNEIKGGQAPYSYFINGQNAEDVTSGLEAGTYNLLISDVNGCTLDKTITLESPIEIIVDADGPNEGEYKELVFVYAVADWPLYNIVEINWYDEMNEYKGSGEEIGIILEKDKTLLVEAIDSMGCVAEAMIHIRINRDYSIFTPNIFSPNNDGNNDIFYLSSQELPNEEYSMSIYDRWGNRVYHNDELLFNDSENGWDGTFNGKNMQAGVYTFLANTSQLEEDIELTGTVTILR